MLNSVSNQDWIDFLDIESENKNRDRIKTKMNDFFKD